MKAKLFLMAFVGLLSITQVNAKPANDKARIIISEKASPEDAARAKELQRDLDRLQALDYNKLSAEEKTAVKQELRGIKKEVKEMDGVYIYLGGGVLLVLLILLLIF